MKKHYYDKTFFKALLLNCVQVLVLIFQNFLGETRRALSCIAQNCKLAGFVASIPRY